MVFSCTLLGVYGWMEAKIGLKRGEYGLGGGEVSRVNVFWGLDAGLDGDF